MSQNSNDSGNAPGKAEGAPADGGRPLPLHDFAALKSTPTPKAPPPPAKPAPPPPPPPEKGG